MITHPLPYQSGAADPDEMAMAYAAAGVISAINGGSYGDIYRLEQLVTEIDAPNMAWQVPFSTHNPHEWSLTQDELKSAWVDMSQAFGRQGGVRLLIIPQSGSWQPWEVDLALRAATILGRLATAGRQPFDPWRSVPPGYLASVAIQSDSAADIAGWHWPPYLLVDVPNSGFEPDQTRYGTKYADRTDQDVRYDFAFYRDSADIADSGLPASAGLYVALTADPEHHLLTEMLMGKSLRRPLAVLPLLPDAAQSIVGFLVDNLAHDAPLDVAIFKAFAQYGHPATLGARPLLIVPRYQYFRDMDAARLSRHVADLAEYLDRFEPYKGADRLDLPRNLPQLEIEKGDVAIADLTRKLMSAVNRNQLRFDHESETGEEVFIINTAIKQYEQHFARYTHSGGVPKMAEPEEEVQEELAAEPDEDGGRHLPITISPSPEYESDAYAAEESAPPDDAPSRPAKAAAQAQSIPTKETPRFTTVALYEGFQWPEAQPKSAPMTDLQPFEAGEDYSFAVALCAEESGIAAGNTRRPARARRLGRETIQVYAVASCAMVGGPVFEDPIQVFDWEFDRDTQPVYFRFTMPDQLHATIPPIEIRLYSKQLHLLDIVEIRHDVASGNVIRKLYWSEKDFAPITAPSNEAENAIGFHIALAPGGYSVQTIFTDQSGETLKLSPHHVMSTQDIDQLLAFIREFWTDKALNLFAEKMQITNYSYNRDVIPAMMDLGKRAWRTLFGRRKGAAAGAVETLGEWVNQIQPPEGTTVRVTTGRGAEGFVFPWAILTPPEAATGDDFWGLKYQIELTSKRGAPLSTQPIKQAAVNVVLDNGFRDFVDHDATLTSLFANRADITVQRSDTSDAIKTALGQTPAADLYYFFCHGSASTRMQGFPEDVLRDLTAKLDASSSSPDLDWRRQVVKLFSTTSQEAQIKTGALTLTESQLQEAIAGFAPRRPIVFLNMCHSADLQPSRSDGLTRVFLDGHAAAVLGTECPMNAPFADAFAKLVLGHLLMAEPLGEAVRLARQHFHRNRNILGFAYTLYGHADATLLDPIAKAEKETSDEH